jgi:hypothetical protein
MADTPKRLAGPALLTASAATVYTVPGATDTVLREVDVCNETGADATLTISIGTDGAGKRLRKGFNVPANGGYQLTCWIPLATGEVIQAYSGTASALTLVLSGIERA